MEASAQSQAQVPPRLKERYEQEVKPALVKQFGYSTPMAVPTLEKITLNMGIGEAKQDTKMLEAATEQLATISGQRPSVRRAKKSIASLRSRCPGSATSAASTRAPSTAEATTRWASKSS